MMCKSLMKAALCLAATLTAHAAPVSWNVNGTFDDGGVLSGSFTFDADTNAIPAWNVGVGGGNTAVFPPFVYSTGVVPVYFNNFLAPEEQFTFYDPSSSRRLILSSVGLLTNAGGTVAMLGFIDNTNFSGECDNCTPVRFLLTGGTFTTTPEPATGSLITAGSLLILLSRQWRRR